MDRISKWAVAGSLAWLVIAVGVVLGTHGDAALGAQEVEAQDANSAAVWSVVAPAKAAPGGDTYRFERC